MKDDWDRFERWLSKNWPDGLDDLNPPASDDEIAKLEEALGTRLPADFVACLKVHNGQKSMAGGLFDNSEFLSVEAILDQWQVWKDLLDGGDFDGVTSDADRGVKNDWWNARWIPFTHNGGGDHYCLDLDPAEGGGHGQVITMWHDAGEREVLATSFKNWFRSYVDEVVDGQYAYSDDYGGLVRIDEL